MPCGLTTRKTYWQWQDTAVIPPRPLSKHSKPVHLRTRIELKETPSFSLGYSQQTLHYQTLNRLSSQQVFESIFVFRCLRWPWPLW
ncbi:hypothetical protein C0J52_02316 [Blattella germanica]|nr:hypothetical protein C0J52_02316 [Blattella germanica]